MADTETNQVHRPVTDGDTDDTTFLLRSTISDLEDALQESRKILTQRDKDMEKLHQEVERYKQQVTKEIVSKTKLAQSLDETEKQARELDELLQQWQLELREKSQQKERMEKMFIEEKNTNIKLAEDLEEAKKRIKVKEKEIEQLKGQLAHLRSTVPDRTSKDHISSPTYSKVSLSEGMDSVEVNFLKQAVFHYLTDYHADEQIRAIISMLDFTAEERKKVYAKLHEKKTRSH